MKNSDSIKFASAQRTEDDVLIDLYCEVLMAYMLVESALGECDLRFELGAALDSGDRERLESAWGDQQVGKRPGGEALLPENQCAYLARAWAAPHDSVGRWRHSLVRRICDWFYCRRPPGSARRLLP